MSEFFSSLRYRMLLPLVVVSMMAAVAVAGVSSRLGARWALRDTLARFEGVARTLNASAFPLTPKVLDLLTDLTGAELVTFDIGGRLMATTLPLVDDDRQSIGEALSRAAARDREILDRPVKLDGNSYLVFVFNRSGAGGASDRVHRVAVLLTQDRVDQVSRQATILPLATGLSTVALLGTWILFVSSRLVRRLIRLEARVHRIASGDFGVAASDRSGDEVGRLGIAVDTMAGQLQQLWDQLQRRQSERMVHQIAGGMAHQLRNTLTGSRMAMELHAQSCPSGAQEDVAVAIRQLEMAEGYVRRLVMVGAKRQQEDQPAEILECFEGVREGQAAIARHLHLDVAWTLDVGLSGFRIADGPTFSSVVDNLVLNAMQAGDRVRVQADLVSGPPVEGPSCRLRVIDNGPGVDEKILDDLFEPFVTTKPEGMGLGLPLVRRAATKFGGEVRYFREAGQTVFEFVCPLAGAGPLTRAGEPA